MDACAARLREALGGETFQALTAEGAAMDADPIASQIGSSLEGRGVHPVRVSQRAEITPLKDRQAPRTDRKMN